MKHFLTAYHTDVGIKKASNQDAFCIKTAQNPENEILLAVICDGMGGLAKGEVASASVIRAFSEWFENNLSEQAYFTNIQQIQYDWSRLILDMNQKLLAYGVENHVQLGTTATAFLILNERQYIIGHVGDTRIYRIDSKIEQLTEDQTLVAREIARGNLTLEEARYDNRRNVLLQCVGAVGDVKPQFITGSLKEDAVYLMCSDGFRHEVAEDELFQMLNPSRMTEERIMKQQLIKLIELNKQRQEKDNISAVLIKIR